MTPTTGEIWLADLGTETRIAVYVASGEHVHRLADRAFVAPLVPPTPSGRLPPWRVEHGPLSVAVDRLTSVALDRLLERQGHASSATVRAVQHTVAQFVGLER